MNSIGKIGVLMPEFTDPQDYELLRGIRSEAKTLGYDVIVYCGIFNSQEEFQQDSYTRGLENIYTLVMQHQLDGVIFAAERFHNQALNAKIQQMLAGREIPCLVLGEERTPLETIYPRQDDGIYRMTRHLIAVHGCRKLYCLTGMPENRTSEARTAGFRRAMAEYGLPVSEDDILYGYFWKDAPREIGRKIAAGEIPMPEGIVCANDSMAAALCQSLMENGIEVPGQIAVTGYDGSSDAWLSAPKLTTVVGREQQFGADAVRRLCDRITGKSSGFSAYEQEIRYGESCGCMPEQISGKTIDAYVLEHFFRHQIWHSVAHKQYYATDRINKMRNQNSLHGWIEAVDQVGHVLPDWEWLDICLCEDWCFDLEHPERFRTEGYPERMLLALSKRHGSNAQAQYLFPTSVILPALQLPHEPRLLLLTSLHNRGQIFGYLAMAYDTPDQICADDFYLSWCEAAVNGLDNLQQVMYREYVRSQMELLTVRDPATGLCSRRGFAEQMPAVLTEMRRRQDDPALLLLTWQSGSGRLPYDPLLVLSNALRETAPAGSLAVRLEDTVLALLYAENAVSAEELLAAVGRVTASLLGGMFHTFHPVSQSIRIPDCPLNELEKIMMQASSALREQAEAAGIDMNAELRKLRQEIAERPQEDWNVTDIAKRLCISKSYLHRVYKQLFQVNLLDDVIEARVAKAKKLLEFSGLRIQEISQQCGYNNESHFMRQFKDKVGMTALQYRQAKQSEA